MFSLNFYTEKETATAKKRKKLSIIFEKKSSKLLVYIFKLIKSLF